MPFAQLRADFLAVGAEFCKHPCMKTPKLEVQEAHWRGIVAGAREAAKVAKKMIESGWTDMETFEAEVWSRVRTGVGHRPAK